MQTALSACRWAARTLCAGNSTAHLVTVLEPESLMLVAPPGEQACLGIDELEPPTPSAAALERAARILGSCRAELEAAGVKPAATTQTTLVSGVNGSAGVDDLLCGFAAGKGADALVTGSRGLGGVHRAALGLVGLGSVSDYVVRHAQARPSFLNYTAHVCERVVFVCAPALTSHSCCMHRCRTWWSTRARLRPGRGAARRRRARGRRVASEARGPRALCVHVCITQPARV